MSEPLTEIFWKYAQSAVMAGGFELHHGIILGADGNLKIMAMDLDGEQAYEAMLRSAAADQAPEAIFALDRFAKDGQGTKYGDLLAGHWLVDLNWRPFIIEYRLDPPTIDPIDFENTFWNDALSRELRQFSAGWLRKVRAGSMEAARG